MIRTQVYLTEELYSQVMMMAKVGKQPVAKLIREALAEGLKKVQTKNGNNLVSFAKMKLSGGPKDLSQNMDEYLY